MPHMFCVGGTSFSHMQKALVFGGIRYWIYPYITHTRCVSVYVYVVRFVRGRRTRSRGRGGEGLLPGTDGDGHERELSVRSGWGDRGQRSRCSGGGPVGAGVRTWTLASAPNRTVRDHIGRPCRSFWVSRGFQNLLKGCRQCRRRRSFHVMVGSLGWR